MIFISSVALIFFQSGRKIGTISLARSQLPEKRSFHYPSFASTSSIAHDQWSHRNAVLSLSVCGALNIFDGIEMLEIVLMQDRIGSIFIFVTSLKLRSLFGHYFLVTSVGFTRSKLRRSRKIVDVQIYNGLHYWRFSLPTCLSYPKICRLVQFWVRTAIFIAKNVISLGIGVVEFWIAGSCKNNLDKVTRVKTSVMLVAKYCSMLFSSFSAV